jgi:dipeptidase D
MLSPKDIFKFESSHKTFEELSKNAKNDLQRSTWKWFVALTEIPRGSGNTAEVAKWLMEMGKKIGCEVQTDKTGNVLIRKPGTKGLENLDGIVLQSHMDMVCTKEADYDFEFLKQPIKVVIDGEWVTADRTTLGADDGSGLAVCLAMMEADFEHAPLETLVTTDEEIGLIGACGLVQGELLKKSSKYLINIDSEDWGEIAISCAGGATRLVKLPLKREKIPKGYVQIDLKIKKLYGGHTGIDIHLGRGNAIKWAMRMLLDNKLTKTGTPIRLISFEGGNAHNAIPSHAIVSFCVPKERADEMVAEMKHIGDMLKGKHNYIEKNAEFEIAKKEPAGAGADGGEHNLDPARARGDPPRSVPVEQRCGQSCRDLAVALRRQDGGRRDCDRGVYPDKLDRRQDGGCAQDA